MSDRNWPTRLGRLMWQDCRFGFSRYQFIVSALVLGCAVGMVLAFVWLALMKEVWLLPLPALAALMVLVQGRLEQPERPDCEVPPAFRIEVQPSISLTRGRFQRRVPERAGSGLQGRSGSEGSE